MSNKDDQRVQQNDARRERRGWKQALRRLLGRIEPKPKKKRK